MIYLWEKRSLEKAWELYRALSASGTADAEAHLLGALTASAGGDHHAARYVLEEAITQQPQGDLLGRIRFRYGAILLRLGYPEAAITEFRRRLEDQGEYPALIPVYLGAAYHNLGLAYRQTGRFDDALHSYCRAADAHRREGLLGPLCETLHNLGWVGCLFGDALAARQALDEARPL